MMDKPYNMASLIALRRFLLRFRKKLTVMGIMGQTQGVNRAMNPPRKPVMKRIHQELSPLLLCLSPRSFSSSTTGCQRTVIEASTASMASVVVGPFMVTEPSGGVVPSRMVEPSGGVVPSMVVTPIGVLEPSNVVVPFAVVEPARLTVFAATVEGVVLLLPAAVSAFKTTSKGSLVGARHCSSLQAI